ncbi:MAG: hypothetical protein WDA12_04980 [Bacilli bacterium]
MLDRNARLKAERAQRAEEFRKRNEAAVAQEAADLLLTPEQRRVRLEEERARKRSDFEQRNKNAAELEIAQSKYSRSRMSDLTGVAGGVRVIRVAPLREVEGQEEKMRRTPLEDKMLRSGEDKSEPTAFASTRARNLAEGHGLPASVFIGLTPSSTHGFTAEDVRKAAETWFGTGDS